jgi:cell wall assembly regulator SMI1
MLVMAALYFMKLMRKVLLALLMLISLTAAGDDINAMKTGWEDFVNWLSASHPDYISLLNRPASIEDIDAAEAKLGYVLPEQLSVLLKINNGESSQSEGVFGTWRFLSLPEQVSSYNELRGDE